MTTEHKPHSELFAAVRRALEEDGECTICGATLPDHRLDCAYPRSWAALRDLEEQFETFLAAAWKFEQEMSGGEFVHFGEFRRALVAASGADRAIEPARCSICGLPEPRHIASCASNPASRSES